VAGPLVWNSLPDYLRDPAVSRDTFSKHLKTFLFVCTDIHSAHWRFYDDAQYKSTSYLLTYLLTYIACFLIIVVIMVLFGQKIF